MTHTTRRCFLKVAVTGTALAASVPMLSVRSAERSSRRMTLSLSCGRIGVRASQLEAIELARQFGFESVDPQAAYLEQLSDDSLQDLIAGMKQQRVEFAAAGVPTEFRRDEARFTADLKRLPQFARSLERAGVTRCGTWISPNHDSLTYLQNFKQHARRLREVARVLGDHGLRMGLEYVGPKTSWTAKRFPFVHTMREMKELIAEIQRPNVGLVLDSWHWYTAHETRADLLSLKNSDIVAVDLNDAPAGLTIDQQIDSQRELPCATGVIDVATFLRTLNELEYDGPVRAEPFNAALRKLPKLDAVAATAKAMKQAFAKLGE